MKNEKNTVFLDFYNCLRLIHKCIQANLLQQPEDDKDAIIVCRTNDAGEERWTMENIHDVAQELQNDVVGQHTLLHALKEKGNGFVMEHFSMDTNTTRRIPASKQAISDFLQSIDWTDLKEYVQKEFGLKDEDNFMLKGWRDGVGFSMEWGKDLSPLFGMLGNYLEKTELKSSYVHIDREVTYDAALLQKEIDAGNYDVTYEDIGGQVAPCVLHINFSIVGQSAAGNEPFTVMVFAARYDNKDKWSFIKTANQNREPVKNEIKNEIVISMGDKEIVAEKNPVDVELDEICVYLRDKGGYITQDLCVVRPHYEYVSHGDTTDINVSDDKVDCLVWEDECDEDYTHSAQIPVWQEETEE